MLLLEVKVCLVLIIVVVLAVRISLNSRRLEANATAIKPSLSSSSFDAATEPPPPPVSFISLASADLDEFFSDTATAMTSQDMEYDFYRETCTRAEKIVRTKMAWIYGQHRDVATQLLRLFFHDYFIEAIPPVMRMALTRDTWISILSRKLSHWWYWVADGDIHIVPSQGAEIEVYKTLDPGVRVIILKALCDNVQENVRR